ncbi:Alpha/Beta hydrolase protein [Rhodocollybia butyracea]|uniref:Alpha/Beta hydrolase protein n=1 Tax=Rhodocollybia butyracea TaxID=206335 RepID=A0A9P5UCU8_9AGAR|nr:Alpha/Beta hydrolase protein [Rhodocollybia butyracea]
MSSSNVGLGMLSKVRTAFTIAGGLYAVAIGLLSVPFFQTHTIYMNALRFPFFADFDAPERYGLAMNKTYNFKIQTVDNETLGAWFILSESIYQSLVSHNTIPKPHHISLALRSRPTILFFHGNAATRAFKARIQHYSAFSSRLDVNVLAIDYRGFAESTGTPSEEGLVRDARAAYEWLISSGAKGEDVLIVGHSLGTGVSSRLAAQLSKEELPYRGVVLMSPFTSISELIKTYNIFGALPLVKPLTMIPYAFNFITWALIHKFDTLSLAPQIKGQVLIAHAENDWDIPYTHSEILFNAFLEPLLPAVDIPSDPVSTTKEDWSAFTAQIAARKSQRDNIVTTTRMANFGVMEEFTDKGGETVVDVVFVKTLEGKHDYIGVQEGLQDIIGRKFGLFGPGAEFRSEEPLIAPPSSATVPVPASPAPSSVVDVGGSDTSEAGGWSPPPSEAGGQEWTAITKIVD